MQLGLSTLSMSDGVRYAPFSFSVFVHDFKGYLNAERLGSIATSSEAETVYAARNGLHRDTSIGAWVLQW